MAPRLRRLAVGVAAATLVSCAAARAADEPSFAVIVAADTGAHELSRETVALIYRKRQAFWPNGARIQPVNLPPADPLRRAFSQCVLDAAPEATEDYWREMYFHGVLPPHVVASEQAVILFVLSTPGAIGYVSSCPPDARIAVAMTVGAPANCPRRSATCAPPQD